MKKLFWISALVAMAGMVVAPFLILAAPLEREMGLVQKIFYFHVPCASVTFLTVYVCGLASVAYLVRRSPLADAVAVTAAELAVLFGACTLVTGMLWARKAWGVWWQWEVRLTTFLLCEMIFIAYLLVRRYGGHGSRGLAAMLAIFGCADVPLIYISVNKWNYLHPQSTVVKTLDPSMRPAFWTSMATMLFVYLALLAARLVHERNRLRLDDLYATAADAGLDDLA
jgi:heme exporter protein C